MNRAMEQAAMGMAAAQHDLERITENLAHAGEVGFQARIADAQGTLPLVAPGKLERSDGPCDLAIVGTGSFVVQRGGEVGYTRAGSFHRDAAGHLVNTAGWHLAGIRIPPQALRLHVEDDGRVLISTEHAGWQRIGRLRLACFAAPEYLAPVDATICRATDRSGPPMLVACGGAQGSTLRFGMLETSNVSMISAMMEMLTTQRIYEANAKGVQAADELLRLANNLQRG